MVRARACVVTMGLCLVAVGGSAGGCSSDDDGIGLGVGSDAGIPPAPAPLPTAFAPCAGVGVIGVGHFALSPDGRNLAAATSSGQLILIDVETGGRTRTFWELEGVLTTVAF